MVRQPPRQASSDAKARPPAREPAVLPRARLRPYASGPMSIDERQVAAGTAPGADPLARERDHEESWYAHVVSRRFFEHEGFRRLVGANLAAFRRQVPLGPSTRLVSLGCGLGDYELALAPSLGEITGFDLSPTAIAEASRRARSAGLPNVRFVERAVEDIDLPDGSVDVVLAVAVFHHFADAATRAGVLDRIRRWLSPGGWIYLWDPSARSLPRRLASPLLRRGARYQSPIEAPLDPYVTAAEVRAAGFHPVRLEFNAPLGGPMPWVVRTDWGPFWTLTHAVDRAWLAVPGLRTLASQFTVAARRPPSAA